MCLKVRRCCDPANVPPVYEPGENRYLCPGPKAPDPCPGGSYCPNVTVIKPCPAGHFCREGTVVPDPCPVRKLREQMNTQTLSGNLTIRNSYLSSQARA